MEVSNAIIPRNETSQQEVIRKIENIIEHFIQTITTSDTRQNSFTVGNIRMRSLSLGIRITKINKT